MPKNHKERREYYRINDVVGLSYRIANDERETETAVQTTENLGLPVKNILAEIDRELNQVTNIIWHENPVIAQALGLLNRKLSIIAAQYFSEDEDQDSIEPYEQLMVNISGSGIAFDCDEEIDSGTTLQLSILLKPSNTVLELSGQVVHVQARRAGATKPFWVRVIFDNANRVHQEQLIQHIVQKQCAQIGYHSKNSEEETSEES